MEDRIGSVTELSAAGVHRLKRDPRILDAFTRGLGMVGEERAAKILYLALTSRLLARPVSVALVGPRSIAKSRLVEGVLRFFPERAYYRLPRGSERFLVHDPEPLAHRMVIVPEAFGRSGERSIIAGLLTDGFVEYSTVIRHADGTFEPLRIEKPGPTGVLFAGAAYELRADEEALCLCIPMNDAPEQIGRVMGALADDDAADAGEDLDAWRGLQQSLGVGETRVHIPFARVVADLIPRIAIRQGGDFARVHDLTGAHALLHRATRELGPHGIVATIEDYAVVRDLVDDTLSAGVRIGATWSVRQTVQAVRALVDDGATSVSVRMLADALGVDRSVASRRVRAAIGAGHLRNEENRRGKPARLVLDEPLHDEVGLLPTPERVMQTLAEGCALDKGPRSHGNDEVVQ